MLLCQPDIRTDIINAAGDTAYDIAYRSGPQLKLFELTEDCLNIWYWAILCQINCLSPASLDIVFWITYQFYSGKYELDQEWQEKMNFK